MKKINYIQISFALSSLIAACAVAYYLIIFLPDNKQKSLDLDLEKYQQRLEHKQNLIGCVENLDNFSTYVREEHSSMQTADYNALEEFVNNKKEECYKIHR